MPNTAESTDVTESEELLVATAQEAVYQSNWIVGECAAKWTTRYARGRTDADFGLLVGLSGDQVYQRRRVWDAFHLKRDTFPSLKWSHYYTALTWDDALECLDWAEETRSTVAEMRAWRRARRGEDLSVAALDEAIQFLQNSPQPVVLPEGGEATAGERAPFEVESGSGVETAGVAPGIAREVGGEGQYSPYKSGATAPASKGAGAEPPTTEQLTKRMTSALERFVHSMGREFAVEFSALPEKVRSRFLRAVKDLNEAVGVLD